MTKLFFRLNDVPDDEAEAVRRLLLEHDIPFYETQSGRWGFSVAAIWLKDTAHLSRARTLLDNYQAEHSALARATYRAAQAAGTAETWLKRCLRQPLRVITALLAVLAVLYLTLAPFFFLV